MQFTVVTVGRPRDAALAAAIREYEERAGRYWPMSYVEVREETGRDRRPDDVRAREAERLAAAIPGGARWFLCESGGKMSTSEEFARCLHKMG
jgi:23S rRNA pseudoU1915 N3-methylase RlmH